jgi:formylglycine-generating enzyme required for sulfatase activity
VQFCEALNKIEFSRRRPPPGYFYRLPTDAEWEYACRAGSEEELSVKAEEVWSRDTSGSRPREVGEKSPNAWGLYDMHGNAMEWCLDAWYEYPKNAAAVVVDPFHAGQAGRDRFVIRGGAWWAPPDMCRSSWRSMNDSEPANGYRGFRIALAPTLVPSQ